MASRGGRGGGRGANMLKGATFEYDTEAKLDVEPNKTFPVGRSALPVRVYANLPAIFRSIRDSKNKAHLRNERKGLCETSARSNLLFTPVPFTHTLPNEISMPRRKPFPKTNSISSMVSMPRQISIRLLGWILIARSTIRQSKPCLI